MAAEQPQPPQNIAQAINEVSERAALLVHEEIELAKAEISQTLTTYRNAAVVVGAASVFFVVGLLFLLEAAAWFIGVEIVDSAWGGFLVVAIVSIVVGVVAVAVAYRWLRRSSSPAPVMAIDEARKIRDAVAASEARY